MANAGPGEIAMHTCDTPSCCNPDHLLIGTYKENTADMYAKARNVDLHGNQCGLSILTERQVRKLKEMMTSGVKNKDLASLFRVDPTTVSNIRTGKSWSWI